MNEAERLENAYRCGQNDGYDHRDKEVTELRAEAVQAVTDLNKMLELNAKLSERLRRLELALADLILYTHTLCRDLRADVGTVANARMFQRAKNNTQAFAIAIGAELAREGVTLVPKNVKLDENGNGGGLL